MSQKIRITGPLGQFLRWPLYLAVLLAAINGLVYMENVKAGVVLSLGLLIYVGVVIVMFLRLRPQIVLDLAAWAGKYETAEKEMLTTLDLPYAVLEPGGRLMWANDAFCAISGLEPDSRKNISSIFPNLSGTALQANADGKAETLLATHEDKVYQANATWFFMKDILTDTGIRVDGTEDIRLLALTLKDETLLRQYIQRSEEDKLVVALAYLDNYEEALETVEEVRRSLLIALIDRKMGRFFSDYDGIVRKIEKDKYFIVMKKGALDRLQQERFPILDDVKTVNIGNAMPVTLSMGIGLGGTSFRQNNEYARIAMEMALGRGGDQTVIKNGSNITYCGGKSLQVEKTTRVKARMKAQALKEFISTRDRVVVMGHKITDVDALGAAIGIYRAGTTLGKPVSIVVNDPTTSIRPLIAGYLDNPEYQPDMFIDSSHAKTIVDDNTALIVVDTNKPSYTECPELLRMTKTIIVLDHHRRGNEVIDNAVLSYVEPYASSACEMVAEVLQYFAEDLKLHYLEADCLYAGIVIDTNNFTTRTGVRTFEAAAFLRRSGADTTRVRKLLRDNIDSYKAKAEAIRTAEIYRNYFAIGVCPNEGLESPTVVGAQAANEMLNIANVKASFVLTRFNQEIYISARAIDEVNVQVMMEKLGGGGHLNIAGAQIKADVDQAKQMLKEIIDRFIEEGGLSK
ncbi:MAG: DHH family phosphoesterase [Blautia sp.]|nr:DHH family phosphoesterase [Blautia sp.]